jgi:hypothetical protein
MGWYHAGGWAYRTGTGVGGTNTYIQVPGMVPGMYVYLPGTPTHET